LLGCTFPLLFSKSDISDIRFVEIGLLRHLFSNQTSQTSHLRSDISSLSLENNSHFSHLFFHPSVFDVSDPFRDWTLNHKFRLEIRCLRRAIQEGWKKRFFLKRHICRASSSTHCVRGNVARHTVPNRKITQDPRDCPKKTQKNPRT